MIAALVSFVSGLSKRGKVVFYAVLIAVCFLMLDRLMRRPILTKMRDLDKEIVETEASIKKALGIVAQEEALLERAVMYARYLKEVGSDEQEKLSLQNYIEILASKCSVDVAVGEVKAHLKPAAEGEGGPGLKTYVVKLTGKGEMEELVSFFYDIETSKENLLKIETFSMTPEKKDPNIIMCTMEITRHVIL